MKADDTITRRALLPVTGLGLLALGSGLLVPEKAAAQKQKKHPKIATAIHELEAVHEYLKTAAHDFGGHRVKAMKTIKEAIEQLEICMKY